jgi:hypothetical protein
MYIRCGHKVHLKNEMLDKYIWKEREWMDSEKELAYFFDK